MLSLLKCISKLPKWVDAVLQALIDSEGVLDDSLEDSIEVIEIVASDADKD